ncbi:MAG: DNA-processing protein DprA [Patescibacteria group bacterium]
MDKDILYYLGFSHFLGIGPMKMAKIMERFGSAKKSYWSNINELSEIIGKRLSDEFAAFRDVFDPVKTIDSYRKRGIVVVSCKSRDYPASLKNIPDPPICLYVKGELKQANFFSIVGTRTPSRYGDKITRKISYDLARAGLAIVSGMALGIDAIAHQAAIDAEAYTVAVLGCGVDVVYPAMHLWLYRKIIATGGAIVSEFPPGSATLKGMFISRNRIISGMSRGVLVIEGGRRSGTLVTARYAAEQGKDMFAVPGMIDVESASAPNLLIKQGAQVVTNVEDILSQYKLKPAKRTGNDMELSESEKLIIDFIRREPVSIQDLVILLNQPADNVLNAMTFLEFKGLVEKNKENKYQVKPY